MICENFIFIITHLSMGGDLLKIICASGSAAVIPLIVNVFLLFVSELLALSKCESNGLIDHMLKMVHPISEGVLLVESSVGLDNSVQLAGALSELVAEKSVDPSD